MAAVAWFTSMLTSWELAVSPMELTTGMCPELHDEQIHGEQMKMDSNFSEWYIMN